MKITSEEKQIKLQLFLTKSLFCEEETHAYLICNVYMFIWKTRKYQLSIWQHSLIIRPLF